MPMISIEKSAWVQITRYDMAMDGQFAVVGDYADTE